MHGPVTLDKLLQIENKVISDFELTNFSTHDHDSFLDFILSQPDIRKVKFSSTNVFHLFCLLAYGDQAFPVAAVRIWNSLPQRLIDLFSKYKNNMKIYSTHISVVWSKKFLY